MLLASPYILRQLTDFHLGVFTQLFSFAAANPYEGVKNARKLTSNHYMPIRVLTKQNSLVSKGLYRKVFDRTEPNFDLDTSLCPGM